MPFKSPRRASETLGGIQATFCASELIRRLE